MHSGYRRSPGEAACLLSSCAAVAAKAEACYVQSKAFSQLVACCNNKYKSSHADSNLLQNLT